MRYLFLIIFHYIYPSIGQCQSVDVINKVDYKITYFKSNHYFDSLNLYSFQMILGKDRFCKPVDLTFDELNRFDEKIQAVLTKYFSQTIKLKNDNWQEWFTYKENLKNKESIIENLNKFNRQVLSCSDENGNKIIYINFYPSKMDNNFNNPDKDLIFDFGGCFSIIFNITKEELNNICVD